MCCRSHSTVKCMVTVELMYQLLHQVTLAMSHCELCVTTLMYFYILCLISVSLKLQLSFHSVLYLMVKLVLCGLEFQKVPKLLNLVVDVYILVVIRNMPSLHTHTHTHTPIHTHTHSLPAIILPSVGAVFCTGHIRNHRLSTHRRQSNTDSLYVSVTFCRHV